MQSPQDYGTVDYLRLRVLPVLGTSPSIFGQAMASFVLSLLGGQPYEPESCERMSKNLRLKIRNGLKKNELERFQTTELVDLDDDELEFVVQQVWRGRCAITGKRFGGHAPLELTRWDPEKPPVASNLVLLAHAERVAVSTVGGKISLDVKMKSHITQRLDWAEKFIAIGQNDCSDGVYLTVDGSYKSKPQNKPPTSSPFSSNSPFVLLGATCLSCGIIFGYTWARIQRY